MNKKKIARKLRTQKDIKNHISIFQTDNWESRKEGIRQKIKNRIAKVQKRKMELTS